MSNLKDVYVQKMKTELDTWNADIAELEAEARQNQIDDLKEGVENTFSSLGDEIRTTHTRLK